MLSPTITSIVYPPESGPLRGDSEVMTGRGMHSKPPILTKLFPPSKLPSSICVDTSVSAGHVTEHAKRSGSICLPIV